MVDRLNGITCLVKISSDSEVLEGGTTDRKIFFFSRSFFSFFEKQAFCSRALTTRTVHDIKKNISVDRNTNKMTFPLAPFPFFIHSLRKVALSSSPSSLSDSFTYAMVWLGTRLLFEGSWGKDSLGNSLDSESIFRIGSLSKNIVNHLFLSLIKEKKVQLDQKIVEFFPDAYFMSSLNEVTFSHLLNHTSGLLSYEEDKSPKIFSSEELFKKGIESPLKFFPGEYFLYSNTGYAVLGYLFERITGSSFNDEIKALARKMGLQSTGYLSDQHQPKWVFGHKKDSSHQVRQEPGGSLHQTKAFSAAGLYSCAKDLREWYTRFLGSELTYTSRDLFTNSQTKIRFGSQPPEKMRYNYGFFVKEDYLDHSGFFPGYLSHVLLNPTQQAGLLILCGNEDADILSMKKELQIQFKELFG